MDLHKNKEAINSAVEMALHYEKHGHSYPRQPFTFNVIKQGSFWELQFIYTEDYKEVQGGDVGEFLEIDKTGSFKEPINEDATIEDLSDIVKSAMEHIYKMEFRG